MSTAQFANFMHTIGQNMNDLNIRQKQIEDQLKTKQPNTSSSDPTILKKITVIEDVLNKYEQRLNIFNEKLLNLSDNLRSMQLRLKTLEASSNSNNQNIN